MIKKFTSFLTLFFLIFSNFLTSFSDDENSDLLDTQSEIQEQDENNLDGKNTESGILDETINPETSSGSQDENQDIQIEEVQEESLEGENTESGTLDETIDPETSSGGQDNSGRGLTDISNDSEINSEGQSNTDTQSGSYLEIPDIIISFQSPSYLLEKELDKEIYYCDSSKTECKVNFDLSKSFSGFTSSKYLCHIDLPFESDEIEKCNPNTIIFPEGKTEIKFIIYEKNNFSNFREKSIQIVNGNDLIDTNSNSGSLNENSGSLDETTDSETSSGSQDNSGSGLTDIPDDSEINSEGQSNTDTQSGSYLEIPDVDIEIQSGLNFSGGIYSCKNLDCKINLNLENLFTGSYDISKYACIWNFSSGSYTTTGTENKCNPGYVNYGTGSFEVKAKIYEKDNPANFKTGSLFFYNGVEIKDEDDITESGSLDEIIDPESSSGGQDNSGRGLTDISNDSEINSEGQSNTNTQSGSYLEIPDIIISFQSPSYLLEKELDKEIYYCDSSKTECKVNFDLSKSFSGFTSSKYLCHIDLPFESDETEKFNPNTIIFPNGESIVNFYIIDKNNETNFTKKTIKIINNPSFQTSGGGVSTETMKEIILQSGAEKTGNDFYECSDKLCKINLQYENNLNETCFWDFSSGIYQEKYKTTCNPSYVYFPSGIFNINLKVYKNGVFSDTKSITIKNNFLELAKESNITPTAKIKLQGKLSKNKELDGNKLICKNTKECSVNFDGSESFDDGDLIYFWDFGNGDFSDEKNPLSIKYTPGKYKIKLEIIDDFGEKSEDYFFVEVYEKEEEVLVLNENIKKYIQIIEALPNPNGSDEDEWIKIKNNSFYFINIIGLEIDDKIGSGSKSYKIKTDFYLLPYQEKKLYKSETKLNLNNSFDEVNLIFNGEVFDSLKWDYEVPEGFVIKKSEKELVKVLSVIDGDTIVIQFNDGKKEKLRFIGVDTPETKHPKKEIEFFGIEASNFTTSILNGKEVYLELDKDNYRDKYGRLLGYIFIKSETNSDFINFNKLLIEKGYGRAYLYFPFKYSNDFEEAQKLAKKQNLGIWSNEEMKNEIKEMEKQEKNESLKNIKFNEEISINNLITNFTNLFDKSTYKELVFDKIFDNLSIFGKNSENKKEFLTNFDLAVSDLIGEKEEIKKTTETKEKQTKIITYKTSKLKSGLKITGTTFPNSKIVLSFDDNFYETNSDGTGSYAFLISDNLKVGEYKIDFLVSYQNEDYVYSPGRNLVLSKDYIFGVQEYKVKLANKTTKTKTTKKKTKKSSTKTIASNTKKLKFEIKDLEQSNNPIKESNMVFVILISLLFSVFGFFTSKKIQF